MIKTIIFDYAGVLTPTRNKYNFAQENHKRFNLQPFELLDISYEHWDKTAVGEQSEKDYWKGIGEKLHTDPDEVRDLVYAAFPIDNMVIKLIDQIKYRYKLVMVSNQIEDWLEKVIDDNDLRNKFHYFANSYQVGVSKPDKKIFLAALERSKSKPDETLFIDDSTENVQAAKRLGMHVIKFETYDQFLREFMRYIDISPEK